LAFAGANISYFLYSAKLWGAERAAKKPRQNPGFNAKPCPPCYFSGIYPTVFTVSCPSAEST
jgi:hypothetical protein